MTISVIIPIFNGAKYLRQCLESIKNQKIRNDNEILEIILIDDNSTDNIEDVFFKEKENLGIQNIFYYKNTKNLGPAKSRNRGTMLAKGDYIAFLDVDDWWEPTKIQKQIDLINKENALFVFTGRKNIYENNSSKNISCMEKVCLNDILKNNCINCSSVMLRKDIAQEFLMERSDLCEDYYTWLRILQKIPYAYGINEPLINYRVQKKSKSSNKFLHAIKRYKVLKLCNIKFFQRVYFITKYAISGVSKYYIGVRKN